ncbi:P-loop containing nucleoside triphosphate hydrolase protein [Mycotypha africana]|uniref:P-loop containing nucleoside triphosphate hydrolase protein n=1 Tax=Mycotypha africana TaxID=64632 RepID=UPI002301202E|nr:P-loop containing nucleoside triphosphate hydrolase protein [Mycotypha africana]KAI8970484.1 P-loop containing nucleoside triphosphate hydrolase protein [Mycotypha africana]
MSVTVRVALRVRPLNGRESKEQERCIIKFSQQQPQQVLLEPDRYFTFDYIYPPEMEQACIYDSCIQPLFDQFILGYNATILAYGQTGSGKTYSMGTAGNVSNESKGIIPRFSENLFKWIENQQNSQQQEQQQQQREHVKFEVKCSFLELYNEEIIDLLKNNKKSNIVIREDNNGNITWSGVYENFIQGSEELLDCLSKGSHSRTTAATDMNSNSSRSHAIFSVTLMQHISTTLNGNSIAKKIESKFHFVDLAGSERLKKTNAIGERAKEGISINSGLLALGNVISALGDETPQQHLHIPYRNSKLTRLLQDSLGGNSQTLMLACISPAESNANETLSTLKYANRAKNIKNTVTINHEQSLLDTLKEENSRLKEELRVNDAFMKEVHFELDNLRAKNQELQTLLQHQNDITAATTNDTKADSIPQQLHVTANLNSCQETCNSDNTTIIDHLPTRSNTSILDEQSQITPTISLSTKRKRSNSPFTDELGKPTLQLMLEKQKGRLRKEYVFAKKIKSDPSALADPNLFLRVINILQLNIKEKKQLITFLEQHQIESQQKGIPQRAATAVISAQSDAITADINSSSSKKKRLLKNDKSANVNMTTKQMDSTLTTTTRHAVKSATNDFDTLALQNNALANQLKQVNTAIKKVLAMSNNPATSLTQIRSILNRVSIAAASDTKACNLRISGATTMKNIAPKVSQDTVANRKRLYTGPLKKVNVEEKLVEIQKIVAFEHLKSHPICAEMMKSLKRQKIKLLHEQRDLLKERKEMLKEFYKDKFQEEQQKQQYMDERIDIITVQVDMITEQLNLLSSPSNSACFSAFDNKNNVKLINILKPLRESDLRALILLIIQRDMVTFNLQSALYQHTLQTLQQFQQGFIQLRRTSDSMNNQILIDMLKSPVRCLSNGLVLISGK